MRLYKDIDSSLPANDSLSSGGIAHPPPSPLSLFASLPTFRFGVHVPARAPEHVLPVCGCIHVRMCVYMIAATVYARDLHAFTHSRLVSCVSKAPTMETRRRETSPSATTTRMTTTISKSFKVEETGGIEESTGRGLCPASLIFSLDYILAGSLRRQSSLEPADTFSFFLKKEKRRKRKRRRRARRKFDLRSIAFLAPRRV